MPSIASNLSFLENLAGAITTGTVNSSGGPITFSISNSEAGRIDLNNYLLLGYTTSQGDYKLQVNGNTIVNGILTVTTANVANLVGTVTTASNIGGGSTGQILIQAAAGLTGFNPGLTYNTSTLRVVGDINFTGNLLQNGGPYGPSGTSSTFVITNLTTSTSTITGALQVAGGAGIGGNANIGGNVNISGTVTGGGIRTTSTSTPPPNPTVGDIWYNTITDDIYRYTTDGVTSAWLDVTGNPGGGSGGASAGKSLVMAMIFGT